ncbi:MAG TPA: glycosyltransferase family 2 protein [Gemmataceae bacterium]|nr:glycosyltransferase family 2 protein [Gemmataceae bacterium]
MPRVSVIVPVRNEAAHIRRTLAGLARQAFPAADFEILVIDGSSSDDTVAVVRDVQQTVPNLHLLFNPKQLSSAARNVGVRHARGEFVVIVDGHCEIRDPNYLDRLVEAFETSGADSLGRPQPLRADRPTPFQTAVAAARTSWLGHNPDSAIYSDRARFVDPDNVAVAYRREVFDAVGSFDESFDACEDVEFNTRCRRAGMSCYFTPAIAVDYRPRHTLGGLAYQMARYGRGRCRLGRKFPSTITIPGLVPPVWLVWLGLGGLASLLWPVAGLVLSATVLVYLAVILAESARVRWSVQGVSFPRLPLVFAAIHVGFGWGFLAELVAGMRPFGLAFALGRALRARLAGWAAKPLAAPSPRSV